MQREVIEAEWNACVIHHIFRSFFLLICSTESLLPVHHARLVPGYMALGLFLRARSGTIDIAQSASIPSYMCDDLYRVQHPVA